MDQESKEIASVAIEAVGSAAEVTEVTFEELDSREEKLIICSCSF